MKIPKGQSETIYMYQKEQTKEKGETCNGRHNTAPKTTDSATHIPLKPGINAGEGKKFLLHKWHPSCYTVEYII